MAVQTYNLKTILSCTDKMSPTLAKVNKSLENFSHKTKVIGHSVGNVGRALQNFGASVVAPFSLVMGAAGFSVVAAAKSFAGYADTLDAVSTKAGTTYKSLQQLRYAAAVNGSSAETMDQALVKLNQTLYNAATGENKDAAALFKTLGISLKDSEGNIRKASDVLPLLAQGFKLNEDPAVRIKMAIALFGKAGADLIPLLIQGSDGLSKMSKRAEELGTVVSDDAVKAGNELNNTLAELSMASNATMGEITKSLAPVIKEIAEPLMKWAAANREVIATKIADWVKTFSDVMKAIPWDSVLTGLEYFGYALAVLQLGKVIVSVIQLGAALKGLMNPYAAAIAIAVAGAIYIYKNWDAIASWFSEVWERACKVVSELWKGLTTVFDAVIADIKKLVPDWLLNFFKGDSKKITIDAKTDKPQADLAQPNAQAVAMSASGAVKGRATIDLRYPNGETQEEEVDMMGGFATVSGDAGVYMDGS